MRKDTHSIAMGYILWIFGFTGSHRFYFGKPVTGTIWMCTFGLFGIGWLVDAFLIPSMDRNCDLKFAEGKFDYNIAWILLTFGGFLGLHRFYVGKWISGLIWLLTGGLFLMGYAWDFWNMNEIVSERNIIEGPSHRAYVS